jgi:hypothetical protein
MEKQMFCEDELLALMRTPLTSAEARIDAIAATPNTLDWNSPPAATATTSTYYDSVDNTPAQEEDDEEDDGGGSNSGSSNSGGVVSTTSSSITDTDADVSAAVLLAIPIADVPAVVGRPGNRSSGRKRTLGVPK